MKKLLQNINLSKETFSQVIKASGQYQRKLKLTFIYNFISALLLAILLTSLYPVFDAIQWLDYKNLVEYLVMTLILGILSLVFRFLSLNYDMDGYSVKAGTDLRLELGDHLRKIPLEKLHQRRSGELNAIFLGNVEEAISYTSTITSLIIFSVTVPVVVTIVMFFIDWRLGLMLLAIFPFSFGLYIWRRPAFNRGFTYLANAVQKMNAELVELIQGISIIKSTNTISNNLNQYQKLCEQVNKIQCMGQKKGGKPNLIIALTIELGLYLAIVLGSVWVVTGSLGATVVATMMVIFVRFNEMFSNLVLYVAVMEVLGVGYKNITDLLNIEKQKVSSGIIKIPENYTITYEHVSFYYENNDSIILNDISLEFQDRSMTAIVGGSGCGKSTLIRLLMRFSDIQKGSIKIGNVDIREMPIEYLMSLITVVFQDVYLFNDTIYNNIRMGRSDATEEEIYQVAKLAQCHSFITRLPDGYDTIVSDNGNNFSGGEKQRISIARALLKNSPIVVLDEPTASLDVENELAVQSAVTELVKNKTVIVISHRLTTISGADNIIVLDNGTVLESGKHDHLLSHSKTYANFWNLQQSIDKIQLIN
ncbi:MAG: ATP-binding cassette domain-containing protein [Neisseriaceae bacterium]|nr:MAG: ATP-binding cassette domain-containing protein [Neisseriaceae bacterium]